MKILFAVLKFLLQSEEIIPVPFILLVKLIRIVKTLFLDHILIIHKELVVVEAVSERCDIMLALPNKFICLILYVSPHRI